MTNTAFSLPNDPQQLRAVATEMAGQLQAYEQQLAEQGKAYLCETRKLEESARQKDQRIEQLLDYIQLLRQKRFGVSSERLSKDQLQLFDEAELEALIGELEAEVEQATAPEPAAPAKADAPDADKPKPKRRSLPAHLKRVERIIDLSEADKARLGDDWVLIGYEEAEQLAVIPRQYYVVHTRRAKYAPANDAVDAPEQGVIIAPRAPQILPKAIGHSSLIAAVVTAKYVDGIPLYRQEKGFAREHIELSRQTMSGWIVQLNPKLAPVMALLKRELTAGPLIQIDETRLQVLNEPGRENTQHSYMWVYRGGPPGQPVIWYQYAESRSAEVPREFLFPPDDAKPPDPGAEPARFYIQSDGYAAYRLLAQEPSVMGHMACFAHVRRKFFEAAQSRKKTGAAHQMVALIGKLYQIERTVKDASPAERHTARLRHATPILETIKAWLDEKLPQTVPGGLLGKAIHYTLNLWPLLTTYLEDGHLEIDNNLTENAIRPFVLGRKGWMFSGSPEGAEASATLYTLVETAKACGLEPHAYLTYLFEHLPTARTPEALRALLPGNLTMQDLS